MCLKRYVKWSENLIHWICVLCCLLSSQFILSYPNIRPSHSSLCPLPCPLSPCPSPSSRLPLSLPSFLPLRFSPSPLPSPDTTYTLSLDVVGELVHPCVRVDTHVLTANSTSSITLSDIMKITLKTQASMLFNKNKGLKQRFGDILMCILFFISLKSHPSPCF